MLVPRERDYSALVVIAGNRSVAGSDGASDRVITGSGVFTHFAAGINIFIISLKGFFIKDIQFLHDKNLGLIRDRKFSKNFRNRQNQQPLPSPF